MTPDERGDRETGLGIMLMVANIGLMDSDARLKDEQTKWEPPTIILTGVTASAVPFGSMGVVLGHLLHQH